MAITTDRGFVMADRYRYDWDKCTAKDGWAQLDTDQDASYYGNWVNPITLQLFSYTEGDTCRITCETKEEFKKEVFKALLWHHDNGYHPQIDTMCNKAIYNAFKEMGFAFDKYDCVVLDGELVFPEETGGVVHARSTRQLRELMGA
jgi:hypothetical protein